MALPRNNICERCRNEAWSLQMSIFNTQMCCTTCLDKEKQHPKYPEARDAELRELEAGNYNFPGIGLPKELEVNI